MSLNSGFQARLEQLNRLLLSLGGLADAHTAASAACALIAADLGDAGVILSCRDPVNLGEQILADYPSGIGIGDISRAETISVCAPTLSGQPIELRAWRSSGDRRFDNDERALLAAVVEHVASLAERLDRAPDPALVSPLDEETGLWSLRPFIDQIERRLDRLDVEDRAGTMFAFGWVRSDGSSRVEANAAVVRASVETLRDMLRPTDLIGRVAPARIAAWCDGVDHLIGAERADRIAARLQTLLADSGRQVAVGLATRWPQSGNDPASLLLRARAGLERARLTAASQAKPVIRIWQEESTDGE